MWVFNRDTCPHILTERLTDSFVPLSVTRSLSPSCVLEETPVQA